MNEERSALESQDADQLRAIATSKKVCVQCLEALESERRALCEAAGFDAGDTGMQSILDWCGRSSGVASAWDELLHSARLCKEINRINGAIGRLRYEHVMSALALFNGITGESPLYSDEGQEASRFEQRALALI